LNSIYIPTYRKSAVTTLRSLSPKLLSRVVLVVESDEEGKRLSRDNTLISYLVSEVQGQGAMKVRSWLTRHSIDKGESVCIQLDDDIKLSLANWIAGKKRFRVPDLLTRFETEFDAVEMEAQVPNVGLASFSQTYFNTSKPYWASFKDNASTYFVNNEAYDRYGIEFDRGIPLEDRSMMLSCIENGLTTRHRTYVGVTKIPNGNQGGENAKGREHRGRLQEESLRDMAEMYPRFVKLRTSSNSKYIENYGTSLTASFYYVNMAKAVQRGENVRDA